MMDIQYSVGNKGKNIKSDVRTIQKLLNRQIHLLSPLLPLKEDGNCGPITIGVICEYQRRIIKMKRVDGRIDPNKHTYKKLIEPTPVEKSSTSVSFDSLLLQVQLWLKSKPNKTAVVDVQNPLKKLTDNAYQKAAVILGVEVATIKAVAEVESMGSGFLANGKPKILFEGHWFSKFTKGQYDSTNSSISYKTWTKKHYLGNEKEYSRLNAAIVYDREAALKSTSWGRFQIMGFNHKACGYTDVESFVKDMYKSEDLQLLAFVKLIKSMKWDAKLKAKDWAGFAKVYNGPRYKENQYDTKMQQAYKAYSSGAN